MLGALVGSVILITNSRTILRAFDAESATAYVVLGAIAAALISIAVSKTRSQAAAAGRAGRAGARDGLSPEAPEPRHASPKCPAAAG